MGFTVSASSTDTVVAIAALSVAAGGVLACSPLSGRCRPPSSAARARGGHRPHQLGGQPRGLRRPYAIGALRDYTGSTAAGMYVLAVTLVLGAACVFAVRPAS